MFEVEYEAPDGAIQKVPANDARHAHSLGYFINHRHRCEVVVYQDGMPVEWFDPLD